MITTLHSSSSQCMSGVSCKNKKDTFYMFVDVFLIGVYSNHIIGYSTMTYIYTWLIYRLSVNPTKVSVYSTKVSVYSTKVSVYSTKVSVHPR